MPPDTKGRRPYSFHERGAASTTFPINASALAALENVGGAFTFEELRRVGKQPFDADGPGADDSDRAAEIPVDLSGAELGIGKARLAVEREAEERRELPFGPRLSRKGRNQNPARCQNPETCAHRVAS